MREALLLIGMIAIVVASLRYPFVGALTILIATVLRDTMIIETYDMFTVYHCYEILYISTVFGLLLTQAERFGDLFPKTPADWGMLGFLVVMVVSAIVNGVEVFEHKYIDLFFKATVTYFLVSRLADTQRRVKITAVALVAATSYLVYLAWSKERTGIVYFARPYLMSGQHEFGLQVVITLPLIGAMLADRMKLRWRLVLLALVPLYVVVAMRTQSRSAYLGMLFGLAMLVWFHRRRPKYILLALPFVVYAVLHNPEAVMARLRSIWTRETAEGTPDGSIEMRLEQWRTAQLVIKSNPIFGVGPRQFFREYEEYVAQSDYKGQTYTMHSVPLLILCEEGLVGFAVYFGLLVLGSLRDAVFVLKRTRGDPALESTAIIGAGALMGFLAFLAYGLGQPLMWVANIYGTVALVTAARRVVEARLAEQSALEEVPEGEPAPALAGRPSTQIVFS